MAPKIGLTIVAAASWPISSDVSSYRFRAARNSHLLSRSPTLSHDDDDDDDGGDGSVENLMDTICDVL